MNPMDTINKLGTNILNTTQIMNPMNISVPGYNNTTLTSILKADPGNWSSIMDMMKNVINTTGISGMPNLNTMPPINTSPIDWTDLFYIDNIIQYFKSMGLNVLEKIKQLFGIDFYKSQFICFLQNSIGNYF